MGKNGSSSRNQRGNKRGRGPPRSAKNAQSSYRDPSLEAVDEERPQSAVDSENESVSTGEDENGDTGMFRLSTLLNNT